jgi:hypothetical protein
VIFVQENHTTDNYFSSLASFGVDTETGWPATPATFQLDNTRVAYFNWLQARQRGMPGAAHNQINSAVQLPFYNYLALNGAFFENHYTAFGTDSTPNHMVILGGQAPIMTNPAGPPTPSWDMPSLPQLAQSHGVSWKGYTDRTYYPFLYYKALAASLDRFAPSDQFETDARAGKLANLSFVYHAMPYDEHPPADVTLGHNKIWSYVTAAVEGGEWDNTVFMLTWDDWGGFDDHVLTPVLEYTTDNVQVGAGPRVPLLMFGGPVAAGIDSRWCSHASIPKTAIQILGLPDLGVARVDDDPGLADRINWNRRAPVPPSFGTTITPPAAPATPPAAAGALPPYPARAPVPLPPVVLNGGATVQVEPYGLLPPQPAPPTSSDPTRSPILTGSP